MDIADGDTHTNALCRDGCPCGSLNTPIENGDKEQVQYDVQDSRQ